MQNILKAQNSGGNENIVPFKKASDKLELPFKAIIKIGTMVIFWEKSSEEVWDLSVDEINKRFYKFSSL